MAVTTEHFYSGNNSTTTFAYTFPYYQTSDIKVKVGGTLKTESTHYNVTGTNIVFTGGNVPPTGTNNIHIYRDTDVDTSKATFAAGSSIRATDLNNNNLQLLYHAQEHDNVIQTGELADAEGKGQIVNANISATAAVAGSKISPDFGSQAVATTGTLAAGATTVTGNIVVSGTVDGRDVAADGTKLDGIEASATGDQTNAEIRAAVEAATDSNVFTDADHSKLNAIEASATADQTGAEIKSAYEGESNTNAYTDAEKTKLAGIAASANNYSISSDLLDEDNMASNSATKVPSQQSVKAYVDSNAGGDTNQNAFSNVAVSGQTTVAADSTTDTLTLAGGSNITITTNDSTDTVTIAASGGEVTVQDEGSALSTAATTINFVGNGVTATGTGATKTVTIPGGGASSIDDDSIVEAKLDIHNAPSGTDKYLKYTANGMEWATAGSGTPEGTAILSTGESGGTKFLREDGDGSCSWQAVPAAGLSNVVEDTSPQLGGALDVQAQEINTSTTNGNIKLTPNGTGLLEVKGNTNPGTIQLNCENNSHGVKIKGPAHSASASYTLTLPDDDGSANQVLKTDGSGNLSWVAQTTDTNTQLSNAEVRTAVEAATDSNVFTDADHTKLNGIAASANAYVHPNHSGEVTSTADGATVIADDVVDEANLKVSNSPTNGYVLTARSGNTGGMTWEEAQGGISDIIEHKAALTANLTIGTGNNGLVAGPFSTGSYTLTIPSGSVFTVV